MIRIKAFLLGVYEFRRAFTWAAPDRADGYTQAELDANYGRGQGFAHYATLRYYDSNH